MKLPVSCTKQCSGRDLLSGAARSHACGDKRLRGSALARQNLRHGIWQSPAGTLAQLRDHALRKRALAGTRSAKGAYVPHRSCQLPASHLTWRGFEAAPGLAACNGALIPAATSQHDSYAKRSEGVAQGAILHGRGLEAHSCQSCWCYSFPRPSAC
jgi:hypothetical protein